MAQLAQIAVVVATVLAILSLIPQIAKLIRTRDPSGVSPSWPAIGLVSNAAWSAYLIHAGLWPASVSTTAMVGFYILVLWALRRAGAPLPGAAARGLGWGVFLVVLTLVSGWFVLGTVLGVSQGVQMAPAVYTAYRTRHPRGISPATWWLSGAEGLLWIYYAWFHGDLPVMIFATTFFASSGLILGRYYWVVARLAEAQPPERTASAS